MSHLSTLLASNLPSEGTAVQQKSYVTFSCLPPSSPLFEPPDKEPTVTLLERRNLISGSSTTGFRTWEAALHLGLYLLSSQAADLIHRKNVIELGAGTGFISILCAKHLGARHVTATDGDEGVVEALKENLFLNGLDDEAKVNASVLRWGRGLRGTWVDDECESYPYDVVLGADIVRIVKFIPTFLVNLLIGPQTYDKTAISALVGTLRMLFELRSSIQVLISGAIRNNETFEYFRYACCKSTYR
jgi:predicted nicotinamide N-methyase